MKVNEKQIENSILDYLALRKIFSFKVENQGTFDFKKKVYRAKKSRLLGIADIIGIYRGKFMAIEVKSAKGKPSVHQIEFISNVKKHGGIAFIARSIEDVERELDVAG